MTIPADTLKNSASPVESASPAIHALGLSLLTAALALPGMDARADNPPEHASMSVKYLHYEESQPDLKRITVNSPSVSVAVPVAGEWLVEGTATTDVVSGASPRYHTAVSGASRMSDRRTAGELELTRYFPRSSVSAGVAYSTEHDYVSKALSLKGSWSSEDKNTVWSAGIGASDDRINPVNKLVADETKTTRNVMAGLTQILTPQDIAQVILTYSKGDGYFSDPYKVLDNRPRTRNQSTVYLRWNHHHANTGGTSRLSYRYYTDSFDIKSHTLTQEYVQPLSQGWTLTPNIRFYTQSAASFYFDPVYSAQLGAPFPPGYTIGSKQVSSADQRLSGFGALTLGLKLSKQLSREWVLDTKLEAYEQRGQWRLFHKGSPGLEPLRATSVQLGLTRIW